jgi:hypothetical protein
MTSNQKRHARRSRIRAVLTNPEIRLAHRQFQQVQQALQKQAKEAKYKTCFQTAYTEYLSVFVRRALRLFPISCDDVGRLIASFLLPGPIFFAKKILRLPPFFKGYDIEYTTRKQMHYSWPMIWANADTLFDLRRLGQCFAERRRGEVCDAFVHVIEKQWAFARRNFHFSLPRVATKRKKKYCATDTCSNFARKRNLCRACFCEQQKPRGRCLSGCCRAWCIS